MLPLLLPVGSHLGESIHVDGGPLAFFFAMHRLQQIEGPGEVFLDGLGGRAVVESLDFRQLVVRAEHRKLHCLGWAYSNRSPVISIRNSRSLAPPRARASAIADRAPGGP